VRQSELQPFVEAARRLEGWQLEFEPVPLSTGPPFSYEPLAAREIGRASAALDLGTGGGERFERLLAGATCRAVATECWNVNAPVAARRLGPDRPVVRASSLALPFRAASFDLVLSRHEEIAPAEVARVLAPGGCILTQQVIHDLWPELTPAFPGLVRFEDHFAAYRAGLQAAGLVVEDAQQFRHRVRYRELGHFVYHLAVASHWMLPGFSLESHADALEEIARWTARDGGLELTEGFTLIRARYPRRRG
jgi:SAM-dependent methyltransferase